MDTMIAKLRVSLGLDTVALERGSKRASAEVGALGSRMDKAGHAVGRLSKTLVAGATAMGGLALASMLKDLVVQGLEYAASLGETAEQLGVTTKSLQEYRYAATQAGIEQDEMDAGLGKLTRSIGEAAAGSKVQTAAFKALGVTLVDAKGRLREGGDVFADVAEGMSKIPDPAERARLAIDIFGKSGQKMLPLLSQGAEGVNALREAARQYGLVLSEKQIQDADKTADKIATLQRVLNIKVAATVSDNAGAIVKLANAMAGLADYAGMVVGRFSDLSEMDLPHIWKWLDGGGSTAQVLSHQKGQIFKGKAENISEWMKPSKKAGKATAPQTGFRVRQFAASNGPAGFDPITGKLDTAALLGQIKSVEALDYKIAGMKSTVSANTTSMMDAIAAQMKRLDAEMVRPAKTAAEQVAREFDEMRSDVRSIMDDLFPEAREEAEFQTKLETIDKALAAAEGKYGFGKEQLQEARNKLIAQRVAPVISDMIAQGEEMNRTLEESFDETFQTSDRVAAANDNIKRSFREMSDDVLGSLQSLVSGIQSGDFLSILTGVISVLESLASVGVFGSSLAGTVNKNRNGGGSGLVQQTLPDPTTGGGFHRYAVGTNYAARGLALVGERGPELLHMRGGERVTPNHQLGGGGGGIAQIVPSKYFDVVVDGRIVSASPGIMQGGAKVAMTQSRWKQSRSIGR